MSDTPTTGVEDQKDPTGVSSDDKMAEEAIASEATQKNSLPSSPVYESAMCSLQSSPAKIPKAPSDDSTSGDAPQSPMKIDEASDAKKAAEGTSTDSNSDGGAPSEGPKDKTELVKADGDDHAQSNMPGSDSSNEAPPTSTPSENVDAATEDNVIADAAAKVEISDDRKKQTKKDVADNKGAAEGSKKAANNKDHSKKKDRSPLRSRANRRHQNGGANNYNRGQDQQASHYGSRSHYNYHGGNGYSSYNNGRYNGYPSGGYRQNNHYQRVTVQNNYGLRSPPYKSNFEPSDSARKKADEFVRASVGIM